MKATIKIDIPDRAKLLAGLTPRDVHPPLVRAEEAAARAEQALSSARRDLAEHEHRVTTMTARVHAGEERVGALEAALRARDARALLIASAEQTLTKARARVVAEEKAAAAAVEREFERRCSLLDRAAAELAPVLDELHDLAAALAAARGTGWMSALDWPCSPLCGANSLARNRSQTR